MLPGVSKANALDDVFWLAVYNLAIHRHEGDMDRFYDILIPFLTGKPLENSLVEMEQHALDGANGTSDPALCSDWRSPQRSETAYVRCVFHAMHYMLRSRGLSSLQSKQVALAIRAQFVAMILNDLQFIHPESNGLRVCNMACAQLSFASVKLANALDKYASSSDSSSQAAILSKEFATVALTHTQQLVDQVRKRLKECEDKTVELPSRLDLSGPTQFNPDGSVLDTDPSLTQYRDLMAWSMEQNDPDPGQAVSLCKYVPIDMLQIPRKASTRDEAVEALRMCDKLCSLLENQDHVCKNVEFLKASLIQHTLTQVIPMPKPRGIRQKDAKQLRAMGRNERRKQRLAKKEKEAYAERMKAQGKLDEIDTPEPSSSSSPSKDTKAALSSIRRASLSKSSASSSEPSVAKDAVIETLNMEAGAAAEQLSIAEACIWDTPMTFALQIELMLTLHRLLEHFVASVSSISASRALDAVCIVIPGCFAALADAVLRRRATDHISDVGVHLMGQTKDGRQLGIPGFGLSVAAFATQTETIEVSYATQT